jgi:hypothetical protein
MPEPRPISRRVRPLSVTFPDSGMRPRRTVWAGFPAGPVVTERRTADLVGIRPAPSRVGRRRSSPRFSSRCPSLSARARHRAKTRLMTASGSTFSPSRSRRSKSRRSASQRATQPWAAGRGSTSTGFSPPVRRQLDSSKDDCDPLAHFRGARMLTTISQGPRQRLLEQT